MSLETLIGFIQSLLAGHGEQVAAIVADPRVLLVSLALTLASISASLVRHGRFASGMVALLAAGGLGATFVGLGRAEFDLHAGRVLIGGDLPAMSAGAAPTTLHDCRTRCSSEPRCSAFSYDSVTRGCSLKAEISRLHDLPGVISGTRHGGALVRTGPPPSRRPPSR